ncbi:alpha-protein kinase 3-like [Entelurus aequoreus]|uniref:alpha-protein kinase 3-like n=1 Tax=Entelurus aequoreus TaxID=161455 RepID=UPI002B1DCDC8|nr:alpha-protein kinase 3-like [Entelurus aequoreus]
MSSRRTTARSLSANGIPSHGNRSNESSRPGSCSYIDNVRPENRSTLFNVITQLTEVQQPSFPTTLRSRAVSENSNVKFYCVVTGYPIPQVTWYKDDKQLDRLCGLPKYEIFRNGQNHSLHIYNCTVDDAAIYQASASNSKGIVSCAGVLEVGVMGEFEIHQRYFAKLKQKAENRSKEIEGKENQEPLRTVSPERWQRKRRSSMEAFLSTPSSTEDEGSNEEGGQSVTLESEVRLEEHAEGLVEEKTSPVISSKINGQVNQENGSVGGKSPFVKKKIRISSSANMERAERMSKEEMEVESYIPPFLPDRAERGKYPSNGSSEELVRPPLEVSQGRVKKEKASDIKAKEKVSEKKTQSPHMTSRLKSTPPSRVMEDLRRTKKVPIMAEKADTSTHADHGSVHLVSPSQTALPGKPPQQTAAQPPKKETKLSPGNASVPSEVTRARTRMSGNVAPVNPEPPPDRRSVGVQPKRKVSATIKDRLTNFITPIVELKQDTRHQSTGSKKSLFARPQKTALISSAGQKSQNGLVAKSVQGIKGNEKVEGNDLSKSVVLGSTSSSGKIQLAEDTRDKVDKASNVCASKGKKTESSLKPNTELQTNEQTKTETVAPRSKEHPNSHEQQPEGFQEISKPVTRIVSVAEILRAQIRALELELASLTNAEDQSITNYDNKCESQVKKSEPESLLDSIVGRTYLREHFVKPNNDSKSNTQDAISTSFQKDPSPSVPALLDKEDDQGFLNTPHVGYLPSISINPKEEATQKPALRATDDGNERKDMGLNRKIIPEIKLTNETQHSSQTVVDQDTIEDPNPTICSQEVQMFADKCVLDTVTQENLCFQKSQSLVKDIFGSAFVRNSNPEASMLLRKQDCDSPSPSATPQEQALGARRKILTSKATLAESTETNLPPDHQPEKQEMSLPDSNVSTILSSPDSAQQSPLLQPKDERTSPIEKKSPLLSLPDSNVSTSPVTILLSPDCAGQSPFLQPKDERTSPVKEKSPLLSFPDSNVSTSPVTILLSPDSAQQSPLLQPKDERTSPVEKKSPPLSLPDSNVSTILSSPDSAGQSPLLQPKDERTSPVEKSPLLSFPDSNVSTSPVTILLSPDSAQQSPLLQPKDERTSPVEKKSPLLSLPDSNVSTSPVTILLSPDCAGQSPFLQPKDERTSPVKEKSPLLSFPDSNVSTSPVTILLSPDSAQQSPLLQPKDERTSPVEKKSPPLSLPDSNVSTSPVTILSSADSAGQSPLLQPKDERTSPVAKKSPQLSFPDSNVSTSPVTILLSPDSAQKSPILQAKDERTSPVEKKSPLLSLPDSNVSTSPVTILSSPDSAGQSPFLQPKDERTSSVEKKSPLLFLPDSNVSTSPVTILLSPDSAQQSPLLQAKDEKTSPVEKSPLMSLPDSNVSTSPVTILSSPDSAQQSPLEQPKDEQTYSLEKKSPLLARKKMTTPLSQTPNEEHQSDKSEKPKPDPCKAPQVIRKIRSERFADASGHLKLWCQFFNILSDSTITWYKNQAEIARIKRNEADESQVNLAVVQASSKDSGVYKCTITNDYGSDSTDFLLGPDILAGISLREDPGVGEEIEMTPQVFSKGVADCGIWGSKLFGRVMVQKPCISEGCTHKVWRAKVIYGLEPLFESGNTCVIKTSRHVAYGGREEHSLIDRNMDLVKLECKIQNLAREYCKIFSAEARVIENFGPPLEVIPVHLMYRPANTIPYATAEADLTGAYQKYVFLDDTGRMERRTASEVELKCCALQHWLFQWTNGNLLITRLEGVDAKLTNIGMAVRSTGHQGLAMEGKPRVFEHFVSQHQCNYFCGLLTLRSLKLLDSLTAPPAKLKGSRSPLLQRKSQAPGSCSPQGGRKAGSSPLLPRKAEQDGRKTPTGQKVADAAETHS